MCIRDRRNSVTDEFPYRFKKRLLFAQTAEAVDAGDPQTTTHSGADDIYVSTAAAPGSPSRDGRDGIQGSLSVLHTHLLSRFGGMHTKTTWIGVGLQTETMRHAQLSPLRRCADDTRVLCFAALSALRRAEKENESVTLQTVPDSTELTRIPARAGRDKKKKEQTKKKELTAVSETAPNRAVSKTDESGVRTKRHSQHYQSGRLKLESVGKQAILKSCCLVQHLTVARSRASRSLSRCMLLAASDSRGHLVNTGA